MQTTTNYNLKKPEANDIYDIGNENDNMDALDTIIHNHAVTLGQTGEAGHNKIIDNLHRSSLTNGEALSAHQGNVLGSLIAPIEVGPNASQAYAKDAQFVYNGLLHSAKAAITQGDELVEDGNMELAPDVVNQITALNSALNDYITYRDVTIGNITIGDRGYANITSYLPTVSGKRLLFVTVYTYGYSSTNDGALTVDCNGGFLSGEANSTITNLTLRYVFIKLAI